MIERKELLVREIEKEGSRIVKDPKYNQIIQTTCETIYKKYNIPMNLSIDVLTLRESANNYDDFILFAISEVFLKGSVSRYFSKTEIKEYSKKKFAIEKIKFPIKWKMVQVSEDQWVGSISVKELMLLRDARLIFYNENTQRPLSRKTVNGEEFYHITINEAAVKAITESYLNGTYIPNVITLNIPETADLSYQNGEIIIKSIDKFDILDGYHRYVAMQRIWAENKDFDYNMEFRLVCFPEEKAKQFIWQEDQKTKMTKIDSDSLNQNNVANQIVNRLNQKAPFTGLINNNRGIIDSGSLSYFLNVYFGKTKQTRKDMIELSDRIYKKFLLLVDADPDILEKKWDLLFIISAVHLIYDGIDSSIYADEVLKLNDLLNLPENNVIIKNFRVKHVNKIDINRVEKIYKGKR